MRISTLLFLCAISLSTLAAYYSIVGLATIFSSAFWPVVFMASILEASKLVVTSWLYHKWNIVSGWVKGYLVTAVVILMLITSLGIFGFLSRAHVDQNLNNAAVQTRIEQINSQISSSNEIIERYRVQLDQLNRSINVQLDNNRATQALAARQRQTAERDQIQQRLDSERQKITDLNQQRIQLQQQIRVLESEVGPIRYVAEFFVSGERVDLEKAVRWMIVILVLVFDPLAVLMLIAANISFAKEQRRAALDSEESTAAQDPRPASGPAIGEIVSIDGKPYRWWDGASWCLIDDRPSSSPNLGDLIRVEGRPIRWWDGSSWKEIDPINQSPPLTDITDEMSRLINEAVERMRPVDVSPPLTDITDEMSRLINEAVERLRPIDVSPANIVTSQEIRDIVKASMDEWLTKASKETQSITEADDTQLPTDVDQEDLGLDEKEPLKPDPTQELEQDVGVPEKKGDKPAQTPTGPTPSWL